jgi:hypothetical protein
MLTILISKRCLNLRHTAVMAWCIRHLLIFLHS